MNEPDYTLPKQLESGDPVTDIVRQAYWEIHMRSLRALITVSLGGTKLTPELHDELSVMLIGDLTHKWYNRMWKGMYKGESLPIELKRG